MARELLFAVTKKDFDETHIRGSGPGGQHRNKTSTGVRLKHRASGAVGEATDSKLQTQNRTNAFKRLRETEAWKLWFRERCLLAEGRRTLQEKLEEAFQPENFRTQTLVGQKWVDNSELTE